MILRKSTYKRSKRILFCTFIRFYMRKQPINIVLLTLIFFGIFIIGDTIYNELLYGNVCPIFTIVPTCYIVFVYLVFLLFFQLKKNGVLGFLFLSGFAVILAGFASVGHVLGSIKCPISDVGIPTCYIGVILFTILTGLKFWEVKSNKKP